MSRTVWPWPDIITTIARRNRTGFFALRVIRASLRPSSIDSGRTNTLGLRAIPTSHTRCGSSVTRTNDEINYLVDSACRATRRRRRAESSLCTVNIVFVEPAFPPTQRHFVRALAEVGASVIGIGERPGDHLDDELKSWM